MKRGKRKKHLHTLGTYWHSSSEIFMFKKNSDIDGYGGIERFFDFCPDCGEKLTLDVIVGQDKNLVGSLK